MISIRKWIVFSISKYCLLRIFASGNRLKFDLHCSKQAIKTTIVYTEHKFEQHQDRRAKNAGGNFPHATEARIT
jgi:hypothetical protein